ncbi:beta-1,6-N-acetylglucosaminyltransferase, partial [Vibrio campbellii]|uniref:beta-1,6-N-acetylglucosaminyltransferase n=1 Tax=Vibrio campbellii TaxID=680 RepID=UPI001E3C8AAC
PTSALHSTVRKLAKNNIVLIHVDSKAEVRDFDSLQRKNVYFLCDRIDIKWGHISMVDATLNLLEYARKFEYKYFSLLSGDDVFVRKLDEFDTVLSGNSLEYIAVEDKDFDVNSRVKLLYDSHYFSKKRSVYIKIRNRLRKIISIKLRMNQNSMFDVLPPLYKGTQWFTLSSKCVDYIIKYVKTTP